MRKKGEGRRGMRGWRGRERDKGRGRRNDGRREEQKEGRGDRASLRGEKEEREINVPDWRNGNET